MSDKQPRRKTVAEKDPADGDVRRLRVQQAGEARWNEVDNPEQLLEVEDDGIFETGNVGPGVDLLSDKGRVFGENVS